MHPTSPDFKASVEALVYSGVSPLFKDLTLLFESAIEGNMGALDKVGETVRKHTNIKLTFKPDEMTGTKAYVCISPLDANNVVFQSYGSSYYGSVGEKVQYTKKVSNLLNGSMAKADKHGRVSGIFAEIETEMHYGLPLLRGMLSAEEAASIVMHETGHIYSAFDTVGRTVATSLLLDSLMEALKDDIDLDSRKAAIESTAIKLQIDGLNTAALAAPGEEEACKAVILRDVVARMRSDVGSSHVFNGEAEFIADSYATRMGAGKYLASALAKIYRSGWHIEAMSTGELITTRALNVALILLAAVAVPVTTLVVGSILSALILSVSGTSDRNRPMERLENIHNDMVAVLKDKRLPDDQVKQMIEDLEFVDALRETLKDRRPIMDAIAYFLMPSRRRTFKQVELQRTIGRLANNDLFARSAELNQLNHV